MRAAGLLIGTGFLTSVALSAVLGSRQLVSYKDTQAGRQAGRQAGKRAGLLHPPSASSMSSVRSTGSNSGRLSWCSSLRPSSFMFSFSSAHGGAVRASWLL